MSKAAKRSTIHLNARLYAALKLKAACTNRSISDIVNEAVRVALAAFEARITEPTMSYEALLKDLKAHGKM